jgi:beta-glucosidase
MYVQHLGAKVERPQLELRGFKRITFQPNESKIISLTLQSDDLAYWNTTNQKFELEQEKAKIMIGSSSADIKLQQEIEIVR